MIRLPAAAFLSALVLSGCVHQTSPNVYDPYAAGQAAYTQMGVVRASRPVTVQNDRPGGTGIGAALGGFAGAVAGSQIGPSRYRHHGHSHRYTSAASVAGTIGGALVGGLLGAAIERDVTRQTATEYVVQMDDGSLVTIVQGAAPLAPGQRVFVQMPEYGRARIVPAV